jgi:acyl-CoA reductase-like NAD-dependent aldehyde dehydrogenase
MTPNASTTAGAASAAVPAAALTQPAAGQPAAAARRTIPCRNPATGELLGEVPAMDAAEVKQRLERARRAQRAFGETSFATRRAILQALLERILDSADEICRLVSAEAGKTLQNAMMGEIFPVCEKLRYTIGSGEDALRTERVPSGLLVHKAARIEYHPLGVIGVISPWNFPFQNILGPTIPALFAGNAVLCKVSEWSSYSAAFVQRMFDEVLSRFGQSPDLFQILTGYGETGAALVRSGVDKIVFTGSVTNGRRVVEGSAERLTPVIMELGGKDPVIVCDDAHLEQAVAGALAGVFICSGQMCLAGERVYVMDGIYDRFVEAVVREASQLRQGDPLGGSGADVDVGTMTMPHQVDIVERLVNDAVSRGARALVGGKRGPGPGWFFQPTVLVDVTHDMAITREEAFGPVLCILRAPSDDEAVVRLANDSSFGLGSTVFTQDPVRARRIARGLCAGSTGINDYGLTYMVQALPFGGVKDSGFGRLNGREGLRAMCNTKSVIDDRLPFLHIPSKIFPVKPGDYETVRAAINLIYRPLDAKGLRARGAALYELAKQALRR